MVECVCVFICCDVGSLCVFNCCEARYVLFPIARLALYVFFNCGEARYVVLPIFRLALYVFLTVVMLRWYLEPKTQIPPVFQSALVVKYYDLGPGYFFMLCRNLEKNIFSLLFMFCIIKT